MTYATRIEPGNGFQFRHPSELRLRGSFGLHPLVSKSIQQIEAKIESLQLPKMQWKRVLGLPVYSLCDEETLLTTPSASEPWEEIGEEAEGTSASGETQAAGQAYEQQSGYEQANTSLGDDPKAPHAYRRRSRAGAYEPISLDDLIDDLGLRAAYLEVQHLLEVDQKSLEPNVRSLLSRDPIVEYLFARAVLVDSFEKPASVVSSISDRQRGIEPLLKAVSDRSLKRYKDQNLIAASDPQLLKIAQLLHDAQPSFSSETFAAAIETGFKRVVFGANEQSLVEIAQTKLGIQVPEHLRGRIENYIGRLNRSSETPLVTEDNVETFVAHALAEAQADASEEDTTSSEPITGSDYSVDYYEDRTAAVEFDRASVEAAAQLYLSMVWGDELGIFETVDRIATQSAGGGGPIRLEVRSKQLSDDLRMYVLDEEFLDLKTGKRMRRVAPGERQMFFRQLFGYGDAPALEESFVNTAFQRYWAVLMTESVKWISKVEESASTLISANKVYQACEDLQYNLSSYCIGLPKIAAPTIYGELDFVIRRILDSDDVKRQLARRGAPTFWKVVEEVRGMQDFTPLRNKGMYGHMILSSVAKADASLVENKTKFSKFISAVEAFILAEDQLAEAAEQAPLPKQFPGFYGLDSMPNMPFNPMAGFGGFGPGSMTPHAGTNGSSPAVGGPSNGSNGTNGARTSDDWNF